MRFDIVTVQHVSENAANLDRGACCDSRNKEAGGISGDLHHRLVGLDLRNEITLRHL
jgi:hypothetical protein